ncbi:DUF1643 domain-containing protein [Brevibacillus dissolubilis]|uniref:DUF1643 domain-containing protein n=1 Tax=Brevibacillus dissolubilis TaxID=1844116 RepID=UPI002100014E|nr:DUF1643 domain-containing protein [Brevibacillus dissolubilis]
MSIQSEFFCYGHFYDLHLDGKKLIECRSVLEIVRNDYRISKSKISTTKPDAIAIMMNPGASIPLDSRPEIIDVENFNINFQTKTLVTAVPDKTQTQIMQIMNNKRWNHIRIINLSDIREKDSRELGKKIGKFEHDTLCMLHSIFSSQRKDERNHALINCKVPIILAWGTNSYTKKYAERCLMLINNHITIGISSDESELFYHHPLTRKVRWVPKMVEQLQNF